MEKKRRIFAAATAVLLLAVILFSYPVIAKNAHHDCTGENCPICMEIQSIMKTVSGFKMMHVKTFLLLVLCVFKHICTVILDLDCTRDTLITLKVELLN